MSDFGEAIGTAVEGGLIAKAVDGDGARETALQKGHFAEGTCLNCGTELIGPHCHSCGQKAHLHRTIGAFMHDLLHGALHFEGRTWKTLPKLLFKPGELTRRYIEGERARFVSPMALFLFVIFLMFAVFQLAGISTPTDFGAGGSSSAAAKASDQITSLRERRDELSSTIEGDTLPEGERALAEAELRELDDQLAALAAAQREIPALKEVLDASGGAGGGGTGRRVETGDDGVTSIPLSSESNTNLTVGPSDWDWLNKALAKWRTSPELMLYKLQTNFYKFSWLLIPLSIPFVWLLFAWKRRFKAYDHAIFVTYSLSFMTLLILAVTLLGIAGVHEAVIVFASLLIPPIHIYKQLRGAYGLSRFSALWRLAVLSIFIVIVLALFLQLLLVIGAF